MSGTQHDSSKSMTGIDEMDKEHKEILLSINKILVCSVFQRFKPTSNVVFQLHQIMVDIKRHFRNEAVCLEMLNYADSDRYTKEYLRQEEEFETILGKLETLNFIELKFALLTWFDSHVLWSNKKGYTPTSQGDRVTSLE